MDYTFQMGSFVNNLMLYATLLFNNLIPVAAILSGISFGVGLVLLVANIVSNGLRRAG